MIFWGLVLLAGAPLIMAALVFLVLRTGGIRRLHDRRHGTSITGDSAGGCDSGGGD